MPMYDRAAPEDGTMSDDDKPDPNTMPNRYNIYNSDGAYNLSVSQSEDGEWVRYDDIAAIPQEQPLRFTPTERLVLHDAAEALECDINHQHSQGCNEISVQLRAMLAESSESVKP
jgi:hypothetical protein